jgi:tryptophan synthase beta chain
MSEQYKYLLDESELPKAWYNINADAPFPPAPVLHPVTKEPVTPDFLSVLFPMSLIMQEMSTDRWIEIPEPVRDVYKLWRPTPFFRAHRLEQALETPAHIYYKYEGASPVGSHKPNTAVAQAYYNKAEGVQALTTETGAGQWGSALSMACNFFDLDLEVYMVRVSYDQKPYRRIMMQSFGADVYASPTDRTQYGRALLADDPGNPGSLGIAISEAVEAAATSGGTKKYSLGSVLNHVLMHQTVVGLETIKQMEMAGEYPDVLIACTGGGSNFGGFAFPFIHQNLTNGGNTKVIATEPSASPTLTRGKYAFDYGDTAKMAPIVKMHTLGHTFVPAGIHAGGLRYHGMAPQVSALVNHGYVEARAVHQLSTFEAAVFNFSGHGYFDMTAYDAYLKGDLHDYEYPAEAIAEAMELLPEVDL